MSISIQELFYANQPKSANILAISSSSCLALFTCFPAGMFTLTFVFPWILFFLSILISPISSLSMSYINKVVRQLPRPRTRSQLGLWACRRFIFAAFWLTAHPESNPLVFHYIFIGPWCESGPLRWRRWCPCPSWLAPAGISYRLEPSSSGCNST